MLLMIRNVNESHVIYVAKLLYKEWLKIVDIFLTNVVFPVPIGPTNPKILPIELGLVINFIPLK